MSAQYKHKPKQQHWLTKSLLCHSIYVKFRNFKHLTNNIMKLKYFHIFFFILFYFILFYCNILLPIYYVACQDEINQQSYNVCTAEIINFPCVSFITYTTLAIINKMSKNNWYGKNIIFNISLSLSLLISN